MLMKHTHLQKEYQGKLRSWVTKGVTESMVKVKLTLNSETLKSVST